MQINSYAKVNSRSDLELENYFGKIKATCARKTLITFFDLVYLCLINIPVFIICAYYEPEKGFITAFHKIIEPERDIHAWRMLVFSVWMCFCFYIYFVFLPAKTKFQTVFSNHLGMKAVTLDDNLNWKGKLSQGKLFRANLIPVFSLPMLSALFFYLAWITNNDDWQHKLLKVSSSKDVELAWYQHWIYGMRVLVPVVFFLQIHHLFTVGASKKALNWLTKSNRIIYVNVERALVVMGTEDKAVPNINNKQDVSAPGGREEIVLNEYDLDLKEGESIIDFASDIDMDHDEWFEKLKQKNAGRSK